MYPPFKIDISLESMEYLQRLYTITLQRISEDKRIKNRHKLDKVNQARKNPIIYKYLAWKYQEMPILQRGGMIYPTTIFPAPEKQWESPESALVNPFECTFQNEDQLITKDTTYVDLLSKAGAPIDNRYTFTMKSLTPKPEIKLRCEIGKYALALGTCDSLEYELLKNADKLNSASSDTFNRFDERLELRRKLHNVVKNPILDGSGRSTAIGTSTLIAQRKKNKFKLFILRRSDQVAIHRKLIHVIPSGMFQPLSDLFVEEEYSIMHNFNREYLEEFYSREEPTSRQHPKKINKDPAIQFLMKLISKGKAKFLLSGISVNLFNLRPEICTVLIIDSKKWPPGDIDIELNEEWGGHSSSDGQFKNYVSGVPTKIESDDIITQTLGITNSNMVPPGAGAFWLGIDLLRGLDSTS